MRFANQESDFTQSRLIDIEQAPIILRANGGYLLSLSFLLNQAMLQALRSYAIPIVMTVVALHQMYRVHIEGLVSWRGGGFGMYASFHPRHHDAWVKDLETLEEFRFEKYDDNDTPLYKAVRPVLTWPVNNKLQQALDRLPEEERKDLAVSVYRLEFDPSSAVLSRKLLAQIPEGGQDDE